MAATALVDNLPTAAPGHDPDGPFGALAPPRLRPGVRRPRLVTPLLAPDGPPFVVVVAPAGYGKTALLSEWCARDVRPFGWLTLHRGHDDPRALLASIARAIEVATWRAAGGGAVLVLDDVQVVRSPPARDALAAIARQPPASLTIALASRTEPPLPIARLRMLGMLTELRAADLAMTRAEAGALMRAAGAPLDGAQLDALARRTEGWPAGLALAALAWAAQGGVASAFARCAGADRLSAEYVRDEVLAPLSDEEARFVLWTSVLGVLTGPLCDALLERTGSAAMLAALSRAGFPLVPLDRAGERFRHHRLLGEILRADLHRDDPALEARLHRRASAWHAGAGDHEYALRHALAAGDVAHAAGLLWSGVAEEVARGDGATVEHRLADFSSEQIAAEPLLAAVAAGAQIAHGRGDLAEHWALAAASAPGAPTSGAAVALRAALGHEGLARMAADSACAAELLAPDSPGQALCALLSGVAAQLVGDRAQARRRLEGGARRAAVAAPQVQALCLAQLALLALDEHDGEEAARASTRARSQIARRGLARLETSCLVLAVSALVRAQRGRVEDAGADAREAAALLERMVDVAPWYELEVQLALARTALRLSDVSGARARIAAARRLAARVPEATAATESLDATERDLERACGARARVTASLTIAELRILHFLPTHLSFREIAERTCVSANTVKTQANAVYRKLDVRSRSDAVACARELGLLDA